MGQQLQAVALWQVDWRGLRWVVVMGQHWQVY